MPRPGIKTFSDLAARATRDSVTGCLVWQGAAGGRPGSFYGHVRYLGRVWLAHRLAWHLTKGPIPATIYGKRAVLDHDSRRCKTKLCIEPEHLGLMTDRQNILKGDGMAARRAAQTHCVKGHPLEWKPWSRVCQPCRRVARAKWREKRRAAMAA